MFIACFIVFAEFEELVARVETSLEQASPSRRRTRVVSSRNRLRRSMVKDHPVFELFVSGSSSGIENAFFCTLCQRDVSIATKGVRELTRHFSSDKHWPLDVTYRVHHGLQVYNKLLDPMELNDAQVQEYLSRPCKEKPEGFNFPEDLLPSCKCAINDNGKLPNRDAAEWWRLPLVAETVGPFPGNAGYGKPFV